jgi:hypothetical protein
MSLESVTFDGGSRLEQIAEEAFEGSGLKSIQIPSSVIVLGPSCFSGCPSLGSVTFEIETRLERIDESMFAQSRVHFRLIYQEFIKSKGQFPRR